MARQPTKTDAVMRRLTMMEETSEGALLSASGDYGEFADVFDLEAETMEILTLEREVVLDFLAIGTRLIGVKAHLTHGEWLPWLRERVGFSERKAEGLMRLAREWKNPQALADLGVTKALTLLSLPEETRESFMTETHEVDGQEKTVTEMSTRELEKAVRDLEAARREAETARSELDAARSELDAAKTAARDAEEWAAKAEEMSVSEAEARASAQAQAERAEAELSELKQAAERMEAERAALRKEVEDLRNRPVEVAVTVDEEATKRAEADGYERGRHEQDAEIRKLKEARKQAQTQAESANTQLEIIRKGRLELETKLKDAWAELERVRDAVAKSAEQAGKIGNENRALYVLLVRQIGEYGNQLYALREKAESSGDTGLSDSIRTDFGKLAELFGGLAK